MTLYLFGAGAYCTLILLSKFSDQECSKTDPASWLAIAIASALWFIVIPISLFASIIRMIYRFLCLGSIPRLPLGKGEETKKGDYNIPHDNGRYYERNVNQY